VLDRIQKSVVGDDWYICGTCPCFTLMSICLWIVEYGYVLVSFDECLEVELKRAKKLIMILKYLKRLVVDL